MKAMKVMKVMKVMQVFGKSQVGFVLMPFVGGDSKAKRKNILGKLD